MMPCQPIPQQDRAFWPWEAEPYKLWSLLDMVKFDCGGLLESLRNVERVRIRAEEGEANLHELQSALNQLYRHCSAMPFPASLISSFRLLLPPYGFASIQEPVILVKSLERGLKEEMTAFGFFAIPPTRTDFYDVKWAGQRIWQKFNDAVPDLRDAGRCYALGQWTASAFHLMRVMERAFRALARRLGVTLQEDLDYADWGTLDRAVKKKIEEEHQKARGKEKTEELEFLSKCALELGYFGNAWRHSICHARINYDGEAAKELLDRVKSFLELLATKLP
jgi:hypothetical protein